MINKETTVTIRPARKIRTKTRRPKFLSLRLELSPENTQLSGEMTGVPATHNHHHQLNLFPLHPENLFDEKDTNVHEYFFSAADDGSGGATTLTGLLGAATSSEDDNGLSPSLTYACGGQDSEEEEGRDLVRTALRNRERNASEEKWVCYSEVTSCAADLHRRNKNVEVIKQRRLSLKLDYQEIMNAWSDKGPLYIQLESPQTVPVLHDDNSPPNGIMDGWGSNGGLWTVPENNFCGNVKMEEGQGLAIGGDQELKMVQREASVLRYKEKRQNRLFSKRIRYEVRKLNAEKRPRMKGRFVKRT